MAETKPTVLYIDDDPALVRLAQRGLSRHGYVVEGAGTIDEGLERLARGGIDAIALDHFLASGTGLDFLGRLADLKLRPPVVYVTASGEVTVAVEALKAGAADYVPKVIGEDFLVLLRRAIDQAITRSRLEQERAAAEEAVRQARDHAEVLLHEVNHRVANSLSLVAALVRMQANSIEDPKARSAIEQVQARISAIAGVHRRLYTSDNVRAVEMASYLSALINELAETMHASGIRIRLVMSGEIEVPTDRAVSLGVVVTELVTNAVKYAYPGGEGEVRIRFERLGDGMLRLSVEDDGVGLADAAAPKGTGVGGRVVAAMARALGSEIVYGRGEPGLTASLTFAA